MSHYRARIAQIVRPNPIVLDPHHAGRVPPRPAYLRTHDYLDRYDATTLYYDVFVCGRRTVALGPPLLNLARDLRRAKIQIDNASVRPGQVRPLDRSHRTVFRRIPSDSWRFEVHFPDRSYETLIGRDINAIYAGRRTLMTLSLDNDLSWVRDWARYHASAHGTDAILFYDNGSRQYELEDILAIISRVPGIDVVTVVDWPFKYGPQGGPTTPWDSDYAQYGALEHARWRFLQHASGFLNADVDELVVTPDGASVYDLARHSRHGAISYPGRWIYPSTPHFADGARPLHADSAMFRPSDPLCSTKWCVVPSRLPERAQCQVHDVRQVKVETPSGLLYRHFRAISTHWKEDRTGDDGVGLRTDEQLATALAKYVNTGP